MSSADKEEDNDEQRCQNDSHRQSNGDVSFLPRLFLFGQRTELVLCLCSNDVPMAVPMATPIPMPTAKVIKDRTESPRRSLFQY